MSLSLCGTEFRNRIGVSPMCQYSAPEGYAADWHTAHIWGSVDAAGSTDRAARSLRCLRAHTF
jgi:2,4-dienoyl-CoA reductase-like NADH-dependent reductase (Old Yellow Enzyme family)